MIGGESEWLGSIDAMGIEHVLLVLIEEKVEHEMNSVIPPEFCF